MINFQFSMNFQLFNFQLLKSCYILKLIVVKFIENWKLEIDHYRLFIYMFSQIDFALTIGVFYWAYLIVVLIFILYSVINYYHLIRFGFFSVINITVMVVYAVVAFWLVWFSLTTLAALDWTRPLFDASWLTGLTDIFSQLK